VRYAVRIYGYFAQIRDTAGLLANRELTLSEKTGLTRMLQNKKNKAAHSPGVVAGCNEGGQPQPSAPQASTIPENGAIGFYNGRPHKLIEKVVNPKKKHNKIEYRLMVRWPESQHRLALHLPEQGIAETRIVQPSEFIIAPKDAPLEYAPYKEALEDKILFKRLLAETDKRVQGEEQSRETLLNCALAILLKGEKNLPHTLINSLSSTGKGHVVKAVFDLFPQHMSEYMTKISPEAFTYWKAKDERWTWDGKLLFLDDVSQKFLNCDTFKVMLTEGSKAVIAKDGEALELNVKGKPVVFLTTAHSVAGDEITNRMNFITLDESEQQTKDILRRQAEEAAGIRKKEPYDWVLTNALSFLECVEVIVPYANEFFQYFPTDSVSVRRDYPRFLTLVKASAALHQFQRERDEEGRVLANHIDYEIARSSFKGFNFVGGLVKIQHKQKKAFDFVVSLLNKHLYTDVDGKPFIKIEDVKSNSLYSPFAWYKTLDKLAEKQLLKKMYKENEYGNKPYVIYKLGKENSAVSLPSFDTLKGG